MKKNLKTGFTLIELLITMTAMVIVLASLGMVLVDNFRNYSVMHKRMYAGPVTDAYISQQVFDNVVRKSTIQKSIITADKQGLEVYYYDDPLTSTTIDRFARFYLNGSNLVVDYGPTINKFTPQSYDERFILAQDVTDVKFSTEQEAITMILTIDNKVNDNTKKEPAITVGVTAFRNN